MNNLHVTKLTKTEIRTINGGNPLLRPIGAGINLLKRAKRTIDNWRNGDEE